MSTFLPVNLEELLRLQAVESTRVEFKASWDERTTGPQVIRTLCAFANDFQNLNGGYVILGVAELGGSAVLPPRGLDAEEIEEAQRWLRGRCNTIEPVYQPIFSPETFDEKRILVIWAPGSDNRPHQAPDDAGRSPYRRRYYVRLGSETVDAEKHADLLRDLLQLTARVPFDDRRAQGVSILEVRETKVREFLLDIRSDLVREEDSKSLYRKLRISSPVNGYDVPRNVALLFFSQDPEQWFPGARIEVVQFSDDAGGNVLEERSFARRPIHEQLRECLAYLENLSVHQVEKLRDRPHAVGWVGFPVPALRESLVNAVYHRSYEGVSEPTKVYLYPDRLEIISYPGPVPGLSLAHFEANRPLPPVPARNRRIGELLKELHPAEGRGTGIPKVRRSMRENGSPAPRYDFDETRTYFRVVLPAHPEYVALLALEDAARLRVVGEAGSSSRTPRARIGPAGSSRKRGYARL